MHFAYIYLYTVSLKWIIIIFFVTVEISVVFISTFDPKYKIEKTKKILGALFFLFIFLIFWLRPLL